MESIFSKKKVLIFKKRKKSYYYDLFIKGIISYGQPSEVYYVEYDSFDNIFSINKKIKNLLISKKIDIFIVTSFYFIDPDLLKSLQGKVFRIKIDGDDLALFDVYSKYYGKLYDINITNTLEIHKKFKELGCNSFIFASPANNNFNEEEQIEEKYDVTFMGLIRNERKNLIEYIKNNKINLSLFGDKNYSKVLSQKDYFKTIKNSKINLNFCSLSHNLDEVFFDKKKLQKLKNMTGRIFEILSCKSFLLTEYNPTLEYFFSPGKDLEVFKSKEELVDKINFYLVNDNLRNKIAEQGYKTFMQKYEFSTYMPHFIKQIDSFKSKNIQIKKLACPREVKKFFTQKYISIYSLLRYEFYFSLFKYFDISLIFKKIFTKVFRI
tara:strand:- start:13107 stop:14243 length:1137 start_codon:yes stop_codon:yes gene_type:complete